MAPHEWAFEKSGVSIMERLQAQWPPSRVTGRGLMIPVIIWLLIPILLLIPASARGQEGQSWWEDQYFEDGIADTFFRDGDGDGHPEICLVDIDQDGGFEYKYRDKNDDGDWDTVVWWVAAEGVWKGVADCWDNDDQPDGDDDFIDTEWNDDNGDGVPDMGELGPGPGSAGPSGPREGSIFVNCGPSSPPCPPVDVPTFCELVSPPPAVPASNTYGLVSMSIVLLGVVWGTLKARQRGAGPGLDASKS